MLKRFIQFFFVLVLIGAGFFVFGAPRADAITDEDLQSTNSHVVCVFENNAHIVCFPQLSITLPIPASNIIANFLGEDLGKQDFWYEPFMSMDAKKPVYIQQTDTGNDQHRIFLTGNSNGAYIGKNAGTQSVVLKILQPDRGLVQPDENICGLGHTTQGCAIGGGPDGPDGKKQSYGAVGFTIRALEKGYDVKKFVEALRLAATAGSCEESPSIGPISFFLCPVANLLTNAVGELTSQDFLTNILTIKGVRSTDQDGKQTPLAAISGGVVTVANTLYVLIFLLIIFSNTVSFGLDNYSIKKMLPRLIAAIILTQFAFLISTLLVDVVNVIGTAMYDFIYSLAAPAGIQYASTTEVFQGMFTRIQSSAFVAGAGGNQGVSAIGVLLAILFLLTGLIGLIVGLGSFMVRYLLVFVLVMIAPLAFAAWVLPGTEKYFKLWWSNFMKLLLMFPIVMGMLALAGIVSLTIIGSIDQDSKDALVQIQIILAACIPIIVLFMIPKTFKWGGNLMAAVGGAVGGYIGGKAAGAGSKVKGAATGGTKKVAGYGLEKGKESGSNYFAGRGNTTAAALLRGKLPGRKGQAEALRQYGAKIEEERKLTANQLTTAGLPEIRQGAGTAMRKMATTPTNARAIGDARAHVDTLLAKGDARGVGYAFTQFRDAARSSGMSNQQIADTWNNQILGDNFGKAKSMSPNLVMTPDDTGSVDASVNSILPMGYNPANGNVGTVNANGSVNDNVFQQTGNFKNVGKTSIPKLDADMLQGINARWDAQEAAMVAGNAAQADIDAARGTYYSGFQFQQGAFEGALTSDTTDWENDKTKREAASIAQRMGWQSTPNPTTAPTQAPTPPTPPTPPLNPNDPGVNTF